MSGNLPLSLWLLSLFAPAPLPIQEALPEGAVRRLGTLRYRIVLRDGSGFATVSLSPDDKYVTAQGDTGLQVWELKTGRSIDWFKPEPSLKAAYFTPDGKVLLTATSEQHNDLPRQIRSRIHLRRREVGTGKLLGETTIDSKEFSVLFPQFAAEGKVFVTGSFAGQTILWDVAKGKQIRAFDEPTTYWNPLCLTRDGKLMAVARRDGTLAVHEVASGKLLYQRPQLGVSQLPGYYAPCFSPDSKTLVCSGLKSLLVLKAADGSLLREIPACRGPVAFSSDGKRFACGANGRIRLFRSDNFEEVRRFEDHYDNDILALGFTSDGKRLISGHGYSIHIWDAETGRLLNAEPGHRGPVISLAFSGDGKRLATGGEDGIAHVWDLETGRPLHRLLGHYRCAVALAFTPDGKQLVSGDGAPALGMGANEAQLRWWDLKQGNLIRQIAAHYGTVRCLRISPDSRSIATSGCDARARVWDFQTGKQRFQVRGGNIQKAAFSPDGRLLLVAGTGDAPGLWNVETGKMVRDLGDSPGEDNHWTWAEFLSDGKTVLASAQFPNDRPRRLKFYETRTGKETRDVLIRAAEAYPQAVALSPDGKLLAFADGWGNKTAELWDVEAGKRLQTVGPHADVVMGVAFSPDGKRLATASRDTTVLVWDLSRFPLRKP